MDQDRIKRRIRGLLNLASDDAAANGEIDNAMRMAAQLMEEHHLSEADVAVEAERKGGAVDQVPDMGTADCAAQGGNLSTWESVLSSAVGSLVGSVKSYRTRAEVKVGTFGRPREKIVIRYYGPAEDAALAAELLAEWSAVIAGLAFGKYGGCFKGDGAQYAYGFACALHTKAREADKARHRVITDSTRALVHVGAPSLGALLEVRKHQAAAWLDSTGVKLARGSRSGGYRAGSHDARSAGRADGARADFTATRRPKLSA